MKHLYKDDTVLALQTTYNSKKLNLLRLIPDLMHFVGLVVSIRFYKLVLLDICYPSE